MQTHQKKSKFTSLRRYKQLVLFHTASFEVSINKIKQTCYENGPVNIRLCMSCSQEPVAQGILPLDCVTSSRTFSSGCTTSRNCDLMFVSIMGNLIRTSITVYDANPSRGLNFETWGLATNRSFLHWELLSPPPPLLLLCRKRHFYNFALVLLFVIYVYTS